MREKKRTTVKFHPFYLPCASTMVRFSIIIGTIIFTNSFMAQSQIYNQYFDGNDTSATNSILINIDASPSNIWQIGQPQKTIFNNAATAPNAIVTDTANHYPTNNTSSFLFGLNNNLFNWGILAIQWTQKLDMDSKKDGGVIEFSTDTGNTWFNAFNNPYVYNFYGFNPENQDTLANGDYAFSGTDSTWKNIWLCFDVSWLSFTDSLMFRYTLKTDLINNNKEGWIIDNFIAHNTFIHTVNEIKQEVYMTANPNPTTGIIDISTKKIDEFHIIEKIELVNIKGDIVQQWGVSPTKFNIDISNHPNGIYFLKVKTNKRSEKFKIILNH